MNYLLKQEQIDSTDPAEYENDMELTFDHINSFLKGFRSQETLPSAQNCTKFLEDSIINFNDTMESWDDENVTSNMTEKDYVFDTTEWISYDLAPSSRYCMSTLTDGYSWYLLKAD